MSQDRPTPEGPNERDELEALLAGALQAQDDGGAAGVDAFVAAHPGHATALREALAELDTAELLQAPRQALPERFGEFRLREQLGAGGMGIVYLAEQTSLGREVALKVVRPELLFFDGARERFRREIDAVARLEHPAIVPILATGQADGVPFYAMPRIRGRSADAVCKAFASREPAALSGTDLRVLLQDGPTEPTATADSVFAGPWWRTIVQLVHQAALGIAHAHARGVLHRDLKPSNLMLTADGRAIVLDFGLAVARGDAKLTRTGTAAGSPAFMAPEQVRGESADERTDVYGLAATLHCLLGLQPPFAAGEGEALKSQILAGARRGLQHAGLPPELLVVLRQAMDVEPARRYRTANAFADDLQAVLDSRPIAARGLPARVRLQRFARRHRVLTTAVVAGAAFVLVVPSVLLWQQKVANDLLAAQVQRSDRSAKVSVDAVQKLLAAVARDRMRHVPEAQDVAAEMLRGAIELFDELRTDAAQERRAHLLGIQALGRLAEVESARGKHDEALAALRAANERLGDGELPPAARYTRTDVRKTLAGLLLDRGEDDEARRVTDAVIADLAVLAPMPEYAARVAGKYGITHYYTAVLAKRQRDVPREEAALLASVAAFARGTDPLAHATAQARLAAFLRQQQRAGEGVALCEAAVRTSRAADVLQTGWPVPKWVEANACQELAYCLVALDRDAAATDTFRQALGAFDEFLRTYPGEYVARKNRGAAAHDLALIFHRQRRWAEVRPLVEAACADQLAVLARNPGDRQAREFLASHRQTLATCLGRLGDLQALEPVARELAATKGNPNLHIGAARGFLRCAEGATQERAAELREEAIELLLGVHRSGGKVDLDNVLYAPIRDDPRVAPLRGR